MPVEIPKRKRALRGLKEYTHAEAVRAVEVTLTAFALFQVTANQMMDLDDAINAFGDADFGAAVVLAQAAMRPRRALEKQRRNGRSLDKLIAKFDGLKRLS